MRQLQPVIWSKGTFLSPQHLQAQERFVEDSARFYLDSLSPYLWGFRKIQIDSKALSEGRLAITLASGLFPDALPIDIPASEYPPPARILDECFRDGRQSCILYLAVPEYRQGGMNVSSEHGRVSTRFTAQMLMVRDENTGTGEKPIQVARKNLQILAEGENREGSVLLGCVRILRSETGIYQVDPSYIPPLIDIHAHPALRRILGNMVELLVARSSQLSGTRRQKNQSLADFSASDVANFWLLYTINSHLPLLRHFLGSSNIHPEPLFNEFSGLAGALTAFSSQIAPKDLPAYDHEQLGLCFGELDRLMRTMLETVIPSNIVALPLQIVRDTVYATSIEKDAYFGGSLFYLAISADIRDAELIDRAPQLLKACSLTQLETFIRNALPGLRLKHVATPPRAIPVKLRHQYFAIEAGGPVWESVQRARNFAVYAPAELLNPQMELIILLAQPV
ncbi:MAG: type VI secretion system baseplate subunit TssK [Terracidiphilus sp.]|jgi:type VI secretion system protein ImpJ